MEYPTECAREEVAGYENKTNNIEGSNEIINEERGHSITNGEIAAGEEMVELYVITTTHDLKKENIKVCSNI